MATKAQILTACPELAEWANRRNAQNLYVLCVLGGEKERAINYDKIMQNKPNLLNTQTNVNLFITKDYRNVYRLGCRKNKPNSNPICGKQAQFTGYSNERRFGSFSCLPNNRIHKWSTDGKLAF